jgi:hypothetical protein
MLNETINSQIALILGVFLLFFLILTIWNITLHLSLKKLKKRNRELFSGNKVENLEEILLSQAKNLKILDKDIQELFNISNQINNLAFRGFHKIGLVRFNPFKDVGGDQSFSIAVLNGKNNGFTISSLFTREGARVYSKSVVGGEAEKYPFTEEEKEAIRIAMKPEAKK